MQNRILGWIIAFGTAFALLYVPFARSGQQTGVHNAPAAANKPFDAHDLTGYWDLTNIGRPSGALNETSDNRPPMTDWAKAMFNKTKTGDNSKLSAGVYPDQSDWNDPLLWCDPTGFPRIMWSYPSSGMRFVQTPDEVMQFFEDGRAWRDVWTDGRKLPGDDAEPRWYGYAVGKWDGDSFVVNSNNYVDKSWLDQYGSPHSDQLTVQERYRRTDRDHLEMVLDITDPKAYTATWRGDKRIFVRVDKPTRSQFSDFDENICVWSEKKIRPKG
ncbi:MAG: hypothetical protein WCA19_11645 [Candidatus Acidiferrales bacterium]